MESIVTFNSQMRTLRSAEAQTLTHIEPSLCAWQVLSTLISAQNSIWCLLESFHLKGTLGDSFYLYPHFTDGNIKTWSSSWEQNEADLLHCS